MTISGGDPLYQKAFNLEVFKQLKAKGIHTTIETSLYGKKEDILELIPYVDKFYADIKIYDDAKHKEIIGVSNKKNILDNFRTLIENEVDVTVRIPLIPGYTDDNNNLSDIASFVFAIDTCVEIELLNYNQLAINKYLTMNQPYQVPKEVKPLSQDAFEQKKELIEQRRYEQLRTEQTAD